MQTDKESDKKKTTTDTNQQRGKRDTVLNAGDRKRVQAAAVENLPTHPVDGSLQERGQAIWASGSQRL